MNSISSRNYNQAIPN